MTKKQALELITLLQMAYPRQQLGEKTVEVYVGFIQDLDYQTAKDVVHNYIRTKKWFPSIAELREACVEATHLLPTTEMAMEIVRTAVRQSRYDLINSHYLVREAVDTVGYEKLGYSEYPEPLYRQVKEAYKKLRGREVERLQNTPGIGSINRHQLEGVKT